MIKNEPFQKTGHWYKAALHVHTTRSDGKRTPEQAASSYRDQDYKVLCVTDHNIITDMTAFQDENFLTIPSIEVNYGRNRAGDDFHVVILGAHGGLNLPVETPVREALAQWTHAGSVMILAHPYWSGMEPDEIAQLEHVHGMEIFNLGSKTEIGKGNATVHWDQVLSQGMPLWGYAVDDAHWSEQSGHVYDAFGAWVCIKADALEQERILAALAEGRCYSSTGPEIYDFRIENGIAEITCSAVQSINFKAQARYGHQQRAEPGQSIQAAEYKLTGKERYLRAECIDAYGRTAWTNPVFLA
jgi:hypothetical protein